MRQTICYCRNYNTELDPFGSKSSGALAGFICAFVWYANSHAHAYSHSNTDTRTHTNSDPYADSNAYSNSECS